MLFFRLFRQCLQTTNKRSLLSRRLGATGEEMFSKNKKSGGVPDRWLDYRAVGERIPRTRFIAFKVPLRAALTRLLPQDQAFGPWELLDTLQAGGQELGLIVDLTFTTRYYKVHDLPTSLLFIKIFTEGHQVPSDQTILSFKRAVQHFLRENPHNDTLIGVHCTHGLNRTGYLVCRYLIDVDGFDPGEAVQLFNASRGHPIERQNYLDDLQSGPRRSNEGMDQSEQDPMRGLAVSRPPPLPIGQDGQQWSREDARHDGQQWSHEAVRQRAAPNQSWGRGVNHQSHPRGGGTNWSHHREVQHQSWRGETNQSHPRGGSNQSHPRREGSDQSHQRREGSDQSHPRREGSDQSHWRREGSDQSHPREGSEQSHPRREGSNQSHPRREGSNQSHPRGGSEQSHPRREGSDQSQPRGGFKQSQPRGGFNQSQPRGGFNQSQPRGGSNHSHPRGGSNHSHPRGGSNHSHPWPSRDQGFPAASPLQGFPPAEGLLPRPPQWIHPSRAAAAPSPHGEGRSFGTKRPRDRPQPEWSSPHSHATSSSFQRGKKSQEHRPPGGPPHPSQLPRYKFPPDHE